MLLFTNYPRLCMSIFFCLLTLPISSYAESPPSNTMAMQFITIPAGNFVMGSCVLSATEKAENASRKVLNLAAVNPHCRAGTQVDEQAAADESPQHTVRFNHPFQLSRHEVTLRQFKQFISDTGRSNFLTQDFIAANAYGDDAPVVAVSWEQAQAFIAWLNRKEG
ncbi:MAG: formylglycine-generating enzyme family protein, partial [Mariprofundaceae bacterium]|nr:formylglycine-generating enzyme family protein [Mariprofundaceae bacterium]